MDHVEQIASAGQLLAIIIRVAVAPAATTFVTAVELEQQVGFVVYPAGGIVPRHLHPPLPRQTSGTSEVIVVKHGRCELDVYDGARSLVATRELAAGDVMLLVAGGHGFRMLEDTVLLEVKQGPYVASEKEAF
ncbi:MAG: hypothetical protein H0W68_08895 [Gemmatimonadaceae bacterium]|nr:hypothetical protein [Gemmatimonadaceae bacterium]